MAAWLAPIWWKSALVALVTSLVLGAAGLLSQFGQRGSTANAFGAVCLFLSGLSLGDAVQRLRAARAPKN